MAAVSVRGNIWSWPLDVALLVMFEPVVELLNGEAMVKYQNLTYKGPILGEDTTTAVVVGKQYQQQQDQFVVSVETIGIARG